MRPNIFVTRRAQNCCLRGPCYLSSDKTVVYTSVDDIIVFAIGTEEDNELARACRCQSLCVVFILIIFGPSLVYPLVDQIIAFVRTLCKKGIISEAEFNDQYPSIAMGISDMVHSGSLDITDLHTIDGLLNFKVEVKKPSK